jgi:hypothetical protein
VRGQFAVIRCRGCTLAVRDGLRGAACSLAARNELVVVDDGLERNGERDQDIDQVAGG